MTSSCLEVSASLSLSLSAVASRGSSSARQRVRLKPLRPLTKRKQQAALQAAGNADICQAHTPLPSLSRPTHNSNTKPRLLRLVAFFSFSWLALSVVMFPASNAELGCAMSDPPGKRHSTASLDADHGSTQYHQAWLHVNAWLLEHTSWGNSKNMARFSHSFELSGPQAPLVQARNLRRPFQIDGGRRWQCSSAAGSKCLRIANLQAAEMHDAKR